MEPELEEWGDLRGLRLLGAALAGAKEVRKANTNRATHGLKGLVLPGMAELLTAPAQAMEEAYAQDLMEEFARVVPADIRAWFRAIPGFGDGMLPARLLGFIGNPYVASPRWWEGKELVAGEDYARTISELWAYCGCGDPALNPCHGRKVSTREDKLAQGQRTRARAVLYSWTDYMKRSAGRSPAIENSKYYKLLVSAREDAAGHEGKCDTGKWPSACSSTHKRHNSECHNKVPPHIGKPNGCGVAAHREWGQPGSPWRPAHLNMHAHRIVHKELLRDLWVVSQ